MSHVTRHVERNGRQWFVADLRNRIVPTLASMTMLLKTSLTCMPSTVRVTEDVMLRVDEPLFVNTAAPFVPARRVSPKLIANDELGVTVTAMS